MPHRYFRVVLTVTITAEFAAPRARIWQIDEPTGFTFTDGFADADFTPVESMPVSTNEFSFEDRDGSTVATYVSTYATAEGLQHVLDMGVVEGSSQAIGQIDDLIKG
ncbi:hypothetical protein JWS13_43420 [Rhodococcus pseudokoreensis]|uniref:Activator of Hsp90 ATPase homolog 1-like protein n=1 Tax=Rhodococcus pseudokoreensis TaxID=2811421 RepID=A0A974ZYR7_9NOCA|nr:hypothetical protein [Rhodococcus pseudokoreensis]QSE94976.1 hypothetical protein JWS13_43420 [Rhodococcus pseudokoreensis]